MQLNSTPGKTLKLRAARSTYFVFSLILLPFLLPVFVTLHKFWINQKVGSLSDLLVLAFFPAVCVLFFVWIGSFQIIVSGSEFSYRTLFAGNRTLPLSEVASAETELGAGKLFGPFHRLVITSKHSSRPIVVNMKVFEKSDLRQLLTILGDRVGEPRYSAISKK